jgi:hypothetical protein
MDSPLTEANYREINTALANLNKARLATEAAKRAGVDVAEQCAVCDYIEQRLNAIKAEYFKGRR